MKKLLSIVLALSLIMSLFCAVPVSAEIPDNLGADYEPDYDVSEYTGNMVNTPWTPSINGNRWNVGGNGAEVVAGTSRGEGWYEFTAARNVGNPLETADGTINYQGTPLSGTNVSFTKAAAGSKGNVVFSFDVTIDSDNPAYGTQMVQIARRLNGGKDEAGQEYPVEYPGVDKGKVLTKNVEEKFQGTFKQVGDTDNANYGAYSVGLPMGSLSGARFEIKGENAYIGFEYPYDIAVSADMTTLYAGGSIVVDADILNQIGKDGDFDDSATWYAMNADRTAAVDGFTIVNGEDGKAEVSVDATVAEGKYCLVAVSNENPDFVKGLEVEVGPNPYADYEPDEKTGNIVKSDWTPGINDSKIALWKDRSDWGTLGIADGNWYGFLTNSALTVPGDNGDGTYNYQTAALYGTNVGFNAPANGTTGNMVFSFDLTTDSGSYTTYVNIGRRNNTAGQVPEGYEFPKEYSTWDDGIKLTKGEITKFTGTFAQVGDVDGDSYGAYSLGLRNGAVAGERFIVNKATAYIGYEYAYDINVTADDNELYAGKSIAVDADIVNQIGKESAAFDQNVSWIAMDADRAARVDGFTFTEGDNGTAEVSVDASVEKGTYTLIAVSDTNKEFVKGIEVEVVANPYADYVPGEKTGNMIATDWVPSLNYNQRDKSGSGDEVSVTDLVSSDGGYRLMASRNLGHPRALYDSSYVATGEYDYHGHSLSGSAIGITAPTEATTGNVVFSFQVKTNSNNEAYGEQKIQVGRRNYSFETTDSRCNEYPVEYSGADKGFPVTTEYQTFSGTFAQPEGMSSADIKGYSIGLPMGTLSGARVLVKREGAYLGYEYAYDLAVSASAETVAQGETVNVTAKVLNQIGKEYAGTKDAITWKAMSTDRTAEIDGIAINDGVVTVADTVEAGTYDIVAVYGDCVMAKGVSIEVTEAAELIEGITISKTAGGITVATDTALTDAQLIFVTYENGKMVSVNIDTKVNLDAQGTQEYTIPSGFETARVLLWSAGFEPLANILN